MVWSVRCALMIRWLETALRICVRLARHGRAVPYDPGKHVNRPASPDAAERVRVCRRQSATLPELQGRLRCLLDGARCCIIGSAPDIVAPPRGTVDRFACVNGSVRAAFEMGIQEPDLTTITGHATSMRDRVAQANTLSWRDRQTGELVFVENGDTVEHAKKLFAEARFRYRRFTPLSVYERAAIIEEVTGLPLGLGRRDDRISMGMFAAVLAIWGGAEEIVLCGFSLQGGHGQLQGATPRHHVAGDTRFLERLSALPVRVSTTSVELQRQFRLPPSS